MSYTTLIIEDEPVLASNMCVYLERQGLQASSCGSWEEADAIVEQLQPDVVVMDFNLPGKDGLHALASLRQRDPSLPVVMTTGHGNEQVAVDAMKAGAFDYLVKPVSLGKLKLVLDRAIHQQRQREEMRHLRRAGETTSLGVDALLGASEVMLTLRQRLHQVIDADLRVGGAMAPAVLIQGETGTGKELVARALHFDGPRRDGPFVELNCASIPATLMEAELFGHERGAYTDARERRIGLVEAADGGTLFLDEIGELELATQAKLLKLLEDRQIRRLGSVREQTIDVRVIAATNRPLEAMSAGGTFRADLFYRLSIVRLDTPPLRDRRDDVALLATHFLERLRQRYGKPTLHFTPATLARMARHAWPGNVRELRNLVEQCVILAHGDEIGVDLLPPRIATPETDAASEADGAAARVLNSLADDAQTLPDIERRVLQQALERHGWNVTRAARALGISRDTLRYRIDKFRLDRPAL